MADSSGVLGRLGEELELVELLGRGGSGAVYRARDLALNRTVAVKVMRGVFGEEKEHALAEARVQAAVSWHANVLSIHGHGVTADGWPYLVLEDAEGGSLRAQVKQSGPMLPADVLRMVAELVDALGAAHRAGVVHCDVKPSNVLFAADGSVRLADFGTALSSTTQTLEFLEGSLVFAPPELLEGRRPTPANDAYGVAVTAWYALAGEVPFGGVDQPAAAAIARIHSEDLDFSGFGLHRVGGELLAKCASKEPALRPDLAEMRATLTSYRPTSSGERSIAAESARAADHVREVLLESVAGRRAVLERLFDDLESDLTATQLVRRLVHDTAADSARAMKPMMDLAARECPSLAGKTLTIEQLQRLTIGEASLMLAGHPSLLAEANTVESASAPTELNEPRWAYREAMRWASAICPDVEVDLTPLHAKRGWVLLAKFAEPGFWDEFFENPDAVNVLDPHTVAILLGSARNLFEVLLTEHWDWFFAHLLARPDLRQTIVFDHPSVVLTGLAACPEAADLVDEHLRKQLQLGLSRMTASERAGIRSVYAAQLESIGLSI